jgi:hypothetical protein
MFGQNENLLELGLEPRTPRLEVWCAIHCATRADNREEF